MVCRCAIAQLRAQVEEVMFVFLRENLPGEKFFYISLFAFFFSSNNGKN
jgi:hypothetical protein